MNLGGATYVLFKELLFPNGLYQLVDTAMDHIQSDKQLVDELGGLPLAVHGYGDGSPGHRRRPVFKESFGVDGRRQVQSSFFVRGEGGEGKVFLEAYEDEQGKWKEKYLVIELMRDSSNNFLILFYFYFLFIEITESRVLIGREEMDALAKVPYKKGWHPFSRFF